MRGAEHGHGGVCMEKEINFNRAGKSMEFEKELAELIGILLGDGSLAIYKSYPYGREKTQYRIKITLNSIKDLQYSKYVSHLIEKIFHRKPVMYKRKGENTLDVFVFGKKHLQFLLDLGLVLSPKWNRAKIPKKFLKRGLGKFVLRGYVDTDGCVYVNRKNYPTIQMKVCPSPMQEQIVNEIRKLGLKPYIQKLDKGKIDIMIHGRKRLKLWNDIIGFSNDRNKNKANKALGLT